MRRKIFSCVMSIFNRIDLFDEFENTVKSVFENSITPDRFHIVVDGPISDKFKKKIFNVKKKYKLIKIHWLKYNVGEAKALNKIIPLIKSEWIVKVDGDDLNLKNRFSEQLKYMKKNYDLIGSNILEEDKVNNQFYKKKLPNSFERIKKFAKYRNPINHMTVAFRKKNFMKVGGYPDICLREDYALWALFIKNNFRIININKYLVIARVNHKFHIRRGSGKYIQSEFQLQKHLVSCGINNFLYASIIFILRSCCFTLSPKIRAIIYKLMLRTNV